jgi:hypothetical protein
MSEQNGKWVVVAKTFNREEAKAWFDLLRSIDIDVQVEPAIDHVELYPGGAMSDQYELSVPADQEQLAHNSLSEIQSFEELDDTEDS